MRDGPTLCERFALIGLVFGIARAFLAGFILVVAVLLLLPFLITRTSTALSSLYLVARSFP